MVLVLSGLIAQPLSAEELATTQTTSASVSSLAANGSDYAATPSNELKDQIDAYLFDAARKGDLEILKVFADSHYDFNRQDAKGYTALILAAYNGRQEAVTFLLANGADPCQEDKRGNTALLGAIFKGEVRIARELMKAECTTNHRNKAGQTPAMYAALFQRQEIMEALKENGADLTVLDNAGNSVESLQRLNEAGR